MEMDLEKPSNGLGGANLNVDTRYLPEEQESMMAPEPEPVQGSANPFRSATQASNPFRQ